MALKIKNNQKILFIGNSITDCGRRDVESPLGNGYVKLFSNLLTIREPAKRIGIINKGIGGETVVDLQRRWYDDVLRNRPDWLSVKIGINDAHLYLMAEPTSVTPEQFFAAYDDILAQTKKKLPKCKILLIEPFYISTDNSKTSFRKTVLDILPRYIEVVRKMSKKYGTLLIRTHNIFQKLLKYNEPDVFCAEPVHPNLTGHIAIAEEVYKVLS